MKAIRVGERIQFYCPGCNRMHEISDKDGGWQFNGDFENPTFSPSVLVKGTHWITDEGIEIVRNGGEVERRKFICHSFVKNGHIQYLNDSTHDLAGQTIELPEVPE